MRHIQNISFQKARDISDKDNLAEQLSNISKENPAMLARNTEFYEDLLFKNLFVVAKDLATNKIVGSGGLVDLGNDRTELSGIHVDENYRGIKIGDKIVSTLKDVAREQSKKILLTMKPNVQGSGGMIVDATRNGFLPVSFGVLNNIPEVYSNCCVCDSNTSDNICSHRDHTCILGVQSEFVGIDDHNNYINSVAFQNAVNDLNLRSRIISICKDYLENNFINKG